MDGGVRSVTTRQSNRVLRAKFFPVLQDEGFVPDKKYGAVLATRDRGCFHDQVEAHVYWVRPRYVKVAVSVRSDDYNEFMAAIDPSWGLDQDLGALDLGTFEAGANPFRPDGARRGWAFDGSEPPEALLESIAPLLVATCRHLESIQGPDALADLIRDHNTLGTLRPASPLAGVLAYAGRYAEAKQICRAALESNQAALAAHVVYSPHARTPLEAIVAYCDARA